MKQAEKRFCSFMQSCRASKILGERWSQILDITKNVSWRNKTPKKTPKMRNRNRPVSSPLQLVRVKIFFLQFFQFSRRIMSF